MVVLPGWRRRGGGKGVETLAPLVFDRFFFRSKKHHPISLSPLSRSPHLAQVELGLVLGLHAVDLDEGGVGVLGALAAGEGRGGKKIGAREKRILNLLHRLQRLNCTGFLNLIILSISAANLR